VSELALPPLVDGELALHVTDRTPAVYQFDMYVGATRVGTASLRVATSAYLERYAGHIGYGVEPAFRGHHYAARACKLLFDVARLHGMRTLWITCNPENVASRRTCELAGGELVDIVEVSPDVDLYHRGERQKCRYRFRL
jgi:predicted acetyltransferase